MEGMDFELLVSLCLGMGLAASCGFRVFVPLLAASVGAQTGWIDPGEGWAWLGTWQASSVLAVATVFEIGAYFFPAIDNMLDSVTSPASVIAGTVVMASSITELPPHVQWVVAIVAGGGAAGVVQGGTVLARMLTLTTTGGIGNLAVSALEAIAGVVMSLLALVLPIIAGVLALMFVIAGLIFFRTIWRRRRLFWPKKRQPGPAPAT